VTAGEDDHWYGGFNAMDDLGDHGPLKADGSSLPPFVGRGVLLDIARYLDVDLLPAGYEITEEDIAGTLATEGVSVLAGDCVLVRTGFMRVWETDQAAQFAGSGLGLAAGCWLADQDIVALGVDNENIEVAPSATPSNPLPLHTEFQIKRGIYFIEMLFLEELARDGVWEFFFVCAGPRIKGTSGAIARPLAIA
jgi:kynurenine formamidase